MGLRSVLARALIAAGERLASVTSAYQSPARAPRLGEMLWLDGVEGDPQSGAHTLIEFGDRGIGRARSLDGMRRVSFAISDLTYLERYGWWTLPGREGVLPNPRSLDPIATSYAGIV